jgi:leucine-zipper-like transcriptional regulator 1
MESSTAENYRKLLEKSEGSDFTIITSDNKELKAHKLILRAQSEYFKRMLANEWKENLENELHINDFDSTIIETLLVFMYCGGNKEEENVDTIKLFEASKRYEVKGLPEICVGYMKDSLSKLNVLKIVQVAFTHDLTILFDCCIDIIAP